jgi:uncharacterized repeat protein (TIGR03803 family)
MLRNRFVSGATTLFLAFLIVLTAARCTEAASKYRILHYFKGKPDGGGVFAGLAFDPKGNLYGTTWGGGSYSSGTVFELSPSSGGKWSEKILHSFCRPGHCTDGDLPENTPTLDAKGNLYDFSSAGVFQMTPGAHGWSFKVIYSGGSRKAKAPNDPAGECGLLLDAQGNLYSACLSLGQNYNGAVSKLSPGTNGWTEKNLLDFCLDPLNGVCVGGNHPQFPLGWDKAGNLYGVTTEGGADKAGVAFRLEYKAGVWEEHVLHSFPAYSGDGYPPSAGLTPDSSGNILGMTQQGGGDRNGTVFELSEQKDGRWKETILYDFNNDGYDPEAGVVLDDKGNLYGTTSEGGPGGYGVVFEITP